MKRRLPASSSARRVAAASLGALTVAGLSAGCMVFSPVQTTVGYVPADGVPASVGDVALRDLALVGGDGRAVISGSAINEGSETIRISMVQQSTDGSTPVGGSEIELAPREQVDLAGANLVLPSVAAKPGAVTTLAITATPGGVTVVTVPVVAAEGYFATVTPPPTSATSAATTPAVTPTTGAAGATTAIATASATN